MTTAVSLRIYRRLLVLYPDELRRDFGDDMALLFADDLESRGAIRVWCDAFLEFLRFAIPAHIGVLRVPAVWLAMSAAIWLAEAAMTCFHAWNPPTFFERIMLALFLPLDSAPFVFLAAVWFNRGDEITPFHIWDR